MVVADTDVVSELMRSEPSAKVLSWLDRRPTRVLIVTAVTGAEVRTGIVLAMRNVRDFDDIGIEVIDPWAAA